MSDLYANFNPEVLTSDFTYNKIYDVVCVQAYNKTSQKGTQMHKFRFIVLLENERTFTIFYDIFFKNLDLNDPAYSAKQKNNLKFYLKDLNKLCQAFGLHNKLSNNELTMQDFHLAKARMAFYKKGDFWKVADIEIKDRPEYSEVNPQIQNGTFKPEKCDVYGNQTIPIPNADVVDDIGNRAPPSNEMDDDIPF